MWLHVHREALSASAPESEGSISGSPAPAEWSLWCTSSGKPSLRPSSWPGWKRRPWHQLLSGTTCLHSTLVRGVDWWISSLEEHRARTSALPGSVLGWMARGADSSSSTSASLSSARPRSSSGRTSPEQLGLFHASASTSKNEATEARGPSFVQVTLAPLTSALASSSWPTPKSSNADKAGALRDFGSKGDPSLATRTNLWPTPSATPWASDGVKGGPNQRGSAGDLMLPSAAAQWPTPTVSGSANRAGRWAKSGDGLRTAAVKRTWPTPSASPWRSGLASEETHARNIRPLNEVACRASLQAPMTETPGAESSQSARTSPPRSQLNPAFVEWLMGWPHGWTLPLVRTACEPVGTVLSQPKPHMPGEDSGEPSSTTDAEQTEAA